MNKKVELAVTRIDNQLEEGWERFTFVDEVYTDEEKKEILREVIEARHWVSKLEVYDAEDEEGRIGTLFVWGEKLEKLEKYYKIKRA